MIVEDREIKILKALAHPIRLNIVNKLREGELCVCELTSDVEFSQSNLSQHLKILKDAGILKSNKEGLRINYSIKNADVLRAIDIIEGIVLYEIKEIKDSIGG